MATTVFAEESAISEEWLTYITNEAYALSRLSDFEIENYADREVLNPEVGQYLDQLDIDTEEQEFVFKSFTALSSAGAFNTFSLSFSEQRETAQFGIRLFKFSRIKEKIRRILCQILSELEEDGTINWKEIIKAVLLALAGGFFGGALGAILLPVLISLIAKIIRMGLDSVCPIA
ncbi:hypothetical protein OGH69_16250 [Flavobacterium sp. MFBS3-15]|uniref:hypothetical protein n=1 Tax=Flavobacterium sp. MFBS3-15 TaxID=2989816 RepID=UPI00223645B2|nr:hypothetical protein [Flavobacterium sp. MFBS3-15]MCW4470524.1 hypothetical protein [Flavobacterium sp. MFBS3-15]